MTKKALEELNLLGEVVMIKKKDQFDGINGLIIPGGESTTIGRIAERYDILNKIKEISSNNIPIMGTCAGLALMARNVHDSKVGKIEQPLLGILDIEVERNAFGRQRESFERNLIIPKIGKKSFLGVFIRAPVISSIFDNRIDILADYEKKIVGVQQDKMIGLAFHPELTSDSRIHEFFINLIF